VILQAAPASFDASTLELWGSLLNGGRLVLVPAAEPSLEDIGRILVREGVTTLWLTAGLFQAMVEDRLEDLRGVRQLLAGGDVLPVAQVEKLRRRFPGCRLINGYGPTENTTFTCCYTVPDRWSGRSIPIGSPVSNTRVYVLDAALQPVPVGVPGELHAGGDGVARGYPGHPGTTAERFVPDPFGPERGARLYRTGDRVRWLGDGTLEFLGRLDEQVKIRGFRIEPGEVEAALRRHAGVTGCAVVAREDAPGEKRLVAYVVGGAEPDDLRAHLRRSLPEHMVPGAFVVLESLPLTPSGKLDRGALPAPGRPSAEERYVAPRTPAEEALAEIWAEVLRLERVGAGDNFFDLGGHSLLIMRLIAGIRAAFDVELSIRTVFSMPTLEAMAGEIERRVYEDIDAMPEDEAEQLAELTPAAGG
jgi:acyl-coenzyme A synthetase/AMP-(fatty) acid ligase/acyl carrier protein